METTTKRHQPARHNWKARYCLGVALNKQMHHTMTLREVAAELGITHQNAYTESCVALGTFMIRMRERLGIPLTIESVETPEICPPTSWSIELEE